MKLLSELLILSEVKRKMDDEEKDLGELIEKYCDANRMYHWEGSRGVSNFEKLIKVLGYRNVDYFLTDNSGCLEAMVEWIKDTGLTDWKESMVKELDDIKEGS
jgi:hypothetical protein